MKDSAGMAFVVAVADVGSVEAVTEVIMVAVGFVDDEDVLLKQNAENDVLLIGAAVTMTNDDNWSMLIQYLTALRTVVTALLSKELEKQLLQ